MTNLTDEPLSGDITFVQHFLPPLPSGKYTIEVEQKVNLKTEIYKFSSTFLVQGKRFSLNFNEIKSVFPPNNSEGDFTNVLPHLVLTRKGTPWERTIGGGSQHPQPTDDVTPWLALLVFNEADPIPPSEHKTLADLTNKLPQGTISYPNLTLEYGEKESDPIITIDVPIALFNQIAPSKEDLTWLAHSRVIASDRKTTNPENESGEYSIIVANRLPQGAKTTVHLVSLEGMENYLPNLEGQPNSSIPANTQFIRLISLNNWSFTATPDKFNFAGLLESLDVNSLQFPYQDAPNSNEDDKLVANAFKMGYVALNHQTRQGDNTVSWYRGPLVPYATEEKVTTPIACADEITYYDPNTGLFDQSYAAAWQLGRLLALNNREFAVSLYNWRRQKQVKTVESIKKVRLQSSLSTTSNSFQDSMANILTEITPEQIRNSHHKTPNDKMANLSEMPKLHSDLPPQIGNWLGKLQLLYHVPFNYLIPEEKMLPVESIRFFQVDGNWIKCLIDGAYSIGRSTKFDLQHDGVFAEDIHNNAAKIASQVRSNLLTKIGVQSNAEDMGDFSGFLIRSTVVSAYPGLEVEGLGERNVLLKLLRFERLFPNVLLCLFAGVVKQIRFHQPPEGVHFGVNLPTAQNPNFTKNIRAVVPLNDQQPEEDLECQVNVSFRNEVQKIVKIHQLADTIHKALLDNKGIDPNHPYTTAEFALQMVEGVEQVIFLNQ